MPPVQAQLANTQARTVEAALPVTPPLQRAAAMESDDDDIQLVQQVPDAPAAAAPPRQQRFQRSFAIETSDVRQARRDAALCNAASMLQADTWALAGCAC